MKYVAWLSILPILLLAPAAHAAEPAPDRAVFEGTITPFLVQHCQKCHGEKKQEADLALHRINGDLLTGPDIETWKGIAERITLGEMPPEDQPQPSPQAKETVLAWIRAELAKAGEDPSEIGQKLRLPGHGNRIDHEALFAADPKTPTASPARLWRLSPHVYTTFVPRVAGKGHKAAQPFSVSSGEGFKDYADLFVVDEPTISQLMRNAAAIVAVQCNPKKPVKEFTPLLDASAEPSPEQVAAAIRRQFQLVLLREPTSEEQERFAGLLIKNRTEAGPVVGTRATLAAVFLLPEALYRQELGRSEPDEHGRRMLSPRELAYAIGFALTDAGPDGELLKAADSGQLNSREEVRRQVERLLSDPKINKPRILRFFEEYFEYREALEVFKDFGRGQWRPDIIVNDTKQLILHILAEDKDVLKQLLTTNKSFVNYTKNADGKAGPARIANKPVDPKKIDPKKPPKPRGMEIWDLYGLPEDWKWTPNQPVELPRDERAGVLTQPSWLSAFATNNETHAIRRGKWVRERLLGGVVPDLPIAVDAKLPDAPEKTMRERMEITRENYCWQCHRKMNPLGLPFEHYDFIGQFRRTETVLDPEATAANVDPKKGTPRGPIDREVPLDASGWIDASGESRLDGDVKDAVQMIHRLADSPRVRQVFVRHAFRYWMGRNETLEDGPTLVAADQAYVRSGGSMNALIQSLLTSDSFLYRREWRVTSGF